ncbi:hypothetical protein [Actinobacillus equuli]|uniref:hypothetical protein n=1 Tax=Actinobacillus equuli TaxID=718 RepID=UPI0024431ABC|nr:hypothetical protein [Actinobacillus equuli]WGE79228.1 hypothetical protein NYR83_10125 [Actinobacillus equuli subsp. equuli]
MPQNNHIVNIRYAIYVYVYLSLYFLWVFSSHISSSQYFILFDYEKYVKILNLSILLILTVFFVCVYRIDESIILDLALIFIFLISYFFSKTGLMLFFFTLFVRYIPFSLVVRTFLLATFCGMFFIYMTYCLDLYPESYLDLSRNSTERSILGYRFPTFLPNYFFHIVLCLIFLRKNNLGIFSLLFLYGINYLLYIYTDTRAVFYLVNSILFVYIFIVFFKINYQTLIIGYVFNFFTRNAFFIFGFIAIYLQIYFDPAIEWMRELNSALSGRLMLGHQGFEIYGIHLFGNFIEYIPMLEADTLSEFFYIDSAYMQLLLTNGLLLYVIVLMGFYKLGSKICECNKPYLGIVIIFLLAHSMTDPQLLSGEFNPFMLLIGYYGMSRSFLLKE